MLLKPEFFAINAIRPAHASEVDDAQLLERIKKALTDDTMTKDYRALLTTGQRKFGKNLAEWNFEHGLLLHRGKVYVPKDQQLRLDLIKLHHDTLPAGHPGRFKTLKLVTQNYWWPGMSVMVKRYVQGCDSCQRNKYSREKPYGLLQPNEVPGGPWEIVTVDLITQLPPAMDFRGEKKTAILVVVDRLTKRAHFYATDDTVTSSQVANVFYNEVFKLHGLPRQIISDRGTQFASKLFQEFCQKLGIKSTMSTAYHPQTDGQTERVNQVLEQYLRMYCNHRQNDWVYYLPTAEFSYNNQTHESTALSPFFVEYGRHPKMAPDVHESIRHPSLEHLFAHRSEAQEQAKAALEVSASRMKWYFDEKKGEVPFKVGDLVLLKGKDLRVKVKSAKLGTQNFGPYKVLQKLGPVTFRLELPKQMKVHPVFHASKLIMYHQDTVANREPPKPPAIEIEGEPEFEVEEILDSKVVRGRVQYLVKWKGYDHSDDTWEPRTNLTNAERASSRIPSTTP